MSDTGYTLPPKGNAVPMTCLPTEYRLGKLEGAIELLRLRVQALERQLSAVSNTGSDEKV